MKANITVSIENVDIQDANQIMIALNQVLHPFLTPYPDAICNAVVRLQPIILEIESPSKVRA